MDFNFIRGATSKELEQFKAVCNQLLSRTYIVRTLFRPGKGRVNNPLYLKICYRQYVELLVPACEFASAPYMALQE